MSENQNHALLLDFSPIRSGGGAQLALNFLTQLPLTPFASHPLTLALPDSGPLAKLDLKDMPVKRSVSVAQSALKRLNFEYRELSRVFREDNIRGIFTFFGPGLPHPPRVKSVVFVAYPIICYPESPFWTHFTGLKSVRQRLKNSIRRGRIRKANAILCETEVMRERLERALRVPAERITVIPPAVSKFIEEARHDASQAPRRFLFLSGPAPHKNLWRLHEIASELEKRSYGDFTFMLSTSREAWLSSLNGPAPDNALLDRRFEFLGSIPPDEIDRVYRDSDVMVNLSDLESFSNNYMEAWKAGMPQVASDRDFARHICGDSAVYAEPHRPDEVAETLVGLASDASRREAMIDEGKRRLAELPDFSRRVGMIYDVLRAEMAQA